MNTSKQRACVVAEVGVNHNGSLALAKKMIKLAAQAGVDAVKFQTFNASSVISKNAKKAAYQKKTTNSQESQLEMVKKFQLSERDHFELFHCCKQHRVEFLSSPFDIESVSLLVKLGVSRIKIPSGEITNAPLLLEIGYSGKPAILSTGMSRLSEIETALSILAYGYLQKSKTVDLNKDLFLKVYFSQEGQKTLRKQITLLHCTTEYPAPFEDVHLRAMDTIAQAFSFPVGLSDHTEGIAVSIAAVARGACMIEKHFTLDKKMSGPDHKASIEFNELQALVKSIRQVEKSLGSSVKLVTPSEIKNKDVARKSLVAASAIRAGETFSEKNITTKRPGLGLNPIYYWALLGKTANYDYKPDNLVRHSEMKSRDSL